MKDIGKIRLTFFLAALLMPLVASASPCDTIDRGLSDKRRADLQKAIINQISVSPVDVLESYASGSWTIVYFDPHEGDKTYAFYSKDPLVNPYVTIWSGGARAEEETDIEKWTLEHAPGIPKELAVCFAWHVTKDK